MPYLFLGLLLVLLGGQLYLGVVAYRHPERAIPRGKGTRDGFWIVLAVVLVVIVLGWMVVVPRLYRS